MQRPVSSNQFASGANQNCGNVITDRPSTRIHHGPGGATSICLGEDSSSIDVSSNKFASGANQNAGNVITGRSSTRIHHGPGGKTSICLGADDTSNIVASVASPVRGSTARSPVVADSTAAAAGARTVADPASPIGAAAPQSEAAVAGISPKQVSSNQFANGANQNAGNVITDRSSTRVSCGPGGNSSICLGGDAAGEAPSAVSSNHFANGSNQNTGNVISDRPSTRLHFAPGGRSSICLGEDLPPANIAQKKADVVVVQDTPATGAVGSTQSPSKTPPAQPSRTPVVAPDSAEKVSSNRWASGASQNTGNVITDRPSTRLHHAPGGASTLCLGSSEETKPVVKTGEKDQNTSANVGVAPKVAPDLGLQQKSRHAPGGASSLVLG